MLINEILARRTDLSTFLVHLTRDDGVVGTSAQQNLKNILQSNELQARNMFGQAKDALANRGLDIDSQKCVCFTETPLQYINLLTEKIEGRKYQFQPYGIAITKKVARKRGVNPIWYIDMSKERNRHDWLTTKLNNLIKISDVGFQDKDIESITPFVEQMYTMGSKKEFWWEREWRHVGNFELPDMFIGICPQDKIKTFEKLTNQKVKFIDPAWSLEQIIGHLAGFSITQI